jgi:hypothetical protein
MTQILGKRERFKIGSSDIDNHKNLKGPPTRIKTNRRTPGSTTLIAAVIRERCFFKNPVE